MSRRVAIAAGVAALMGWALGAGTATAAQAGCAHTSLVADDATLRQAVDAVRCLVNVERANEGLRPVRASRQLSRAARAHSRDMVTRGFFAHIAPGGQTPRQRILRTGYIGAGADINEALGWGSAELSTPEQLMLAMMASPSHARIVLDPRYRDIGVGLALGAPISEPAGDAATLTLDFGRRR